MENKPKKVYRCFAVVGGRAFGPLLPWTEAGRARATLLARKVAAVAKLGSYGIDGREYTQYELADLDWRSQ